MRRGQFMCLRDDVRVGRLEVICRLGFWSGQQDWRAKKSSVHPHLACLFS
jgi:hypothetical protein